MSGMGIFAAWGRAQFYGYRIFGPYAPHQGHRFNPNKLLLDPYAKSVVGPFTWVDEHFGYQIGDPAEDLSFDERDNADQMLKGRVIDARFDWENDRPLRTAWRDTVIYELHVKGFYKKTSQSSRTFAWKLFRTVFRRGDSPFKETRHYRRRTDAGSCLS